MMRTPPRVRSTGTARSVPTLLPTGDRKVRRKGRITTWFDDKGYGFISPADGEGRVFVHIKAFGKPRRRPVLGDSVTYATATDRRGRPCAADVSIAGAGSGSGAVGVGAPLARRHAMTVAVGFLLLLGAAVGLSLIPVPVLLLYVLLSGATFLVYAFDKSAAANGGWRTPENTLHLLSLAGGWPGALVAQDRLRHKSRKQPFRAVFWSTVLLNCAVLAWLLTPAGADLWRDMVGHLAH